MVTSGDIPFRNAPGLSLLSQARIPDQVGIEGTGEDPAGSNGGRLRRAGVAGDHRIGRIDKRDVNRAKVGNVKGVRPIAGGKKFPGQRASGVGKPKSNLGPGARNPIDGIVAGFVESSCLPRPYTIWERQTTIFKA